MKSPYDIILQPYITEKSAAQSYGDPNVKEEADLVRKYTFLVAKSANKLEIKSAIESIYNSGKKKKDEMIEVEQVRTITMKGKKKRVRSRYNIAGHRPDRKKAIVTLAKGQMLEDYGV